MPIIDHNVSPREEPTLEDLLRDPIVHLAMQSDGLDEDTVRQVMKEAALRQAMRSPETLP